MNTVTELRKNADMKYARYHSLKRGVFICLIAILLIMSVYHVAMAFEKEELTPLTEYISFGVKAKQLFDSHTSYEFGNPFPPYQAPLSKLEFPLDSWWGGVELRFNFPRFSIGGDVFTNAQGDTQGRMKDSDWDDEEILDLQTIYSESNCRLEPSYTARVDVDLEVADWLGMPRWFSLRPVVGFRYQNFHMITNDGTQYTLGEPPLALPGYGIRFKQKYWQYFTGIRSIIDIGQFTNVSDLKLFFQLDWAYVEGSNEDKHLLRAGNRYTFEKSYGEAWHGSMGLKKGLTKNLTLGFELDYLQISTTGNHRLVNNLFSIDFSTGYEVKVWSEQTSVLFSLEYRFN